MGLEKNTDFVLTLLFLIYKQQCVLCIFLIHIKGDCGAPVKQLI